MSPQTIYRRTFIFNWIELGLCSILIFVPILVAYLIYAFLYYNGWHIEVAVQIGIVCVSFLVCVFLYKLIHPKCFSLNIGRLAILERAVDGGENPKNCLKYTRTVLPQRFGDDSGDSAYSRFKFYYYRILTTVLQVKRLLLESYSLSNSATPHRGVGIDKISSSVAVDCCIAYILQKKDYELNAAIVDAVTYFAGFWTACSADIVKLKRMRYIVNGILLVIGCFPIGIILGCQYFSWNFEWIQISWLPIFVLSYSLFILIIFSIKCAFLDTWIQTQTTYQFLKYCKEASIDPTDYRKLDVWSEQYAVFRKWARQKADEAKVLP